MAEPRLRWRRFLRSLRSRQYVVAWDAEARAELHPLTLRTHWVGNKSSLSAQLELEVTDEASGAVLLKLHGGYVDGGQGERAYPADAVIATDQATSRAGAACKLRASDAWSWTLQPMRTGSASSDLECSVCMAPFHQPVRFPAQPGSPCGHVYCRECLIRCLAPEKQSHAGGPTAAAPCPLCRAPLADGMTAKAVASLPIDAEVAAKVAADVAYHCAPFAVNYVSNSSSAWMAASDGDGTLPKDLMVARIGGCVRMWSGKAPRKLATASELERSALLGFADCAARSEQWPSKRTCIKEFALGVGPHLLREASKEDLATILAILTEEFWARGGHSNQPMFSRQLSNM